MSGFARAQTSGADAPVEEKEEISMDKKALATATFIKQRNGNGDGRVYRLDPPMPVHNWSGENDHDADDCSGADPCESTEYVWVSAADVIFSGPETFIFACDESGEVTDWGELPGSLRGDLDHRAALSGAGYEIKEN